MSHFIFLFLTLLVIAALGYIVWLSGKPNNSTTLPTSNYLTTLKQILDKALHRNDIPKN